MKSTAKRTAQSAIDPQANLPTGPTHVAARTNRTTRTAADGEWTPTDRWAWACELPVSAIARAVANCIARHANNKTGMGWPGIGTIVSETGFKRTAVIAAIKELERGGHVSVSRFKVGKRNTANRYQLPPMVNMSVSHPSAPDGLGSAPDGLGGSAPDGPESVSSESVQESVSSSRARLVCAECSNTWPAKFGPTCYQCGQTPSTATPTPTPTEEAVINPDGYRGGRVRNCPQCRTLERGHEDTCQHCDWTRAAWEARNA